MRYTVDGIKFIAFVMFMISFIFLIISGYYVFCYKSEADTNLDVKAGRFVTSDVRKDSLFITKVVGEGDNISQVCVVLQQFPNGVFENCLNKGYFDGYMKVTESYITKESKYIYR